MSARSEPESAPAPTTARLSIGEVVGLLRPEFGDLTDSKIRFLEDRKLISPARTPSGYRSFGPHDIEVLRWILTRQRDQYLPLSIIGERIDRGEHLVDIWGIGADDAPATAAVTSLADAESDDDTAAGDDDTAAGDDDTAETSDEAETDVAAAETSGVPEISGPRESSAAATTGPPWDPRDDPRTYSAAELSAASGLSTDEIAELAEFGLLVPLEGSDASRLPRAHEADVQASLELEPPEPRYSSGALLVARISREFATYGLEARHLRVIRNAAARDATLFEQGIQPVLHAGGSSAKADAQRSLGRLVALCERLRAQVMGESLHRYWQ